MARVKTIYPSDEIYHLWANEAVAYATTRARNKSFDGDAAYSYRAVIARIVRNERGERAFLLAARRWTVTTSKHQGQMRGAIPSDALVFTVSDIDADASPDHLENLEHYSRTIADLTGSISRARKNGPYLRERMLETQEEANRYCQFFDLAPLFDATMLEEARARYAVERAELEAKQEAEYQARAEQTRIEDEDKVVGWLAGVPHVRPSFSYPDTLLRLSADGAEVETSRGATVPVTHARRLYSKLVSGTLAGGDRAGHYAVNRVEESEVIIGCHRIARSEIERFAALVGWTEVNHA